MKKERLEEIKEEYNFSVEQSLANRIPDSDIEWLIKTIEEQQATIDTLSMAHDNMARELSLFKEKDKHELIKANIALNRRVQELEDVNSQLERQAPGVELDLLNMELIDALKQNKRYREVINKFFELEGSYKDIVNRAERMFIKVLDEIGG